MEKIETIEKLHKIELEELIAFDTFCKEHDLKYSLGAGTLLGAVRHQGFIPWDDDIDLFMERPYYNKLMELSKQNKTFGGKYEILTLLEKKFPYPFIKIVNRKTKVIEGTAKTNIGVWLDIFPVDYCGETLAEATKTRLRFSKYQRVLISRSWKIDRKSFSKRFKHSVHTFLDLLQGLTEKNVKNRIINAKFPDKAKYAGTIVYSFKDQDIYPAEYFESGYTELPFEGISFSVFKEYQKILAHRYGNYLELPPEEQRISHITEAYILDGENSILCQ